MSESFKIVSIDPGNNVGVSILTISTSTLEILNIETKTFILENIIPVYVYDKILYKLSIIKRIIDDVCVEHNPLAVGIEVAFLNTKFPKAVMQLSQYVAMIEHTLLNYNPFIKIFKYPPRYIKVKVTGNGNADKDDMKTGVKYIPELNNLINVNTLSEHEIDAMSIGYTVLMEIREYPWCLLAIL